MKTKMQSIDFSIMPHDGVSSGIFSMLILCVIRSQNDDQSNITFNIIEKKGNKEKKMKKKNPRRIQNKMVHVMIVN